MIVSCTRWLWLVGILVVVSALSACDDSPPPSPTATPAPAPTNTATPTATPAPSPTPTYTATPTATPAPSPTPTYTATPTATPAPSPTPTYTATPTATPAPSPTPTYTATPTATPAPSPTPTYTATPTATPAPSPTPTYTATPTATPAPSPTPTASSQVRAFDAVGYGHGGVTIVGYEETGRIRVWRQSDGKGAIRSMDDLSNPLRGQTSERTKISVWVGPGGEVSALMAMDEGRVIVWSGLNDTEPTIVRLQSSSALLSTLQSGEELFFIVSTPEGAAAVYKLPATDPPHELEPLAVHVPRGL